MTLTDAMFLPQELGPKHGIIPKYRRWRRTSWLNRYAWIQQADLLGRIRDQDWHTPDFTVSDLSADDWEEVTE